MRFGVFEVDLETEELRKNGVKIRLSGQPFQILALLLERSGGEVTRQELRRELWSEGTFVDFDHCLNTAVNKLREAIGDSADTPRFIQTLPRRGYRFLFPVERIERDVPAASTAAREPRLAEEAGGGGRGRSARRLWAAAGGLAALAAVAAMVWTLGSTAGPKANRAVRAVPLTHFGGAQITPAFSPDGADLAFSWNGEKQDNFDIYVRPLDSAEPLRLTAGPAAEFAPAYSPDGRLIAFYRRSGDAAAIYTVHPAPSDPSEAVRLMGLNFGPPDPLAALAGGGTPETISWSPDGKLLAYVDRKSPDEPFSIFFRSIESRENRRVSRPPPGSVGDGGPAISPDGRSLAFVRRTSPAEADIYVASLPDGGASRLTHDSRPIYGLAWSADSGRIVYSSGRDGAPSLWSAPLDGGEPERLETTGENAILPVISLRGSRLGYVRRASGARVRRVELPGDGRPPGAAIELDALPSEVAVARFSPDGKRIVFAANRGGVGAIWSSDAEGGDLRVLARMGDLAGSPRWAPDGSRVAFDSMQDGDWNVYSVAAQGGEAQRLTEYDGTDVRPSWSHEGEWVYFGSDRSGTMQIWKAPADGAGQAVRITANGGYEPVESADGRALYYTRRGLPGLWTVAAAGGPETLLIEDLQWENSRNWEVADEGVYFIWKDARTDAFTLKLFRFATRRSEPILDFRDARPVDAGCSISPDGRWSLYAGADETQADIEILERFE